MPETEQSTQGSAGLRSDDGFGRLPTEDPEMEWANELASMSQETKILIAQLAAQSRTIQQYRCECAEKDSQRMTAEAHSRILRDALALAVNTVECASTDGRGNDLPWYRAAKAALALSPNDQAQRLHKAISLA